MKIRSWLLSTCSSTISISKADEDDDEDKSPQPETGRVMLPPTPCRYLLSDTSSCSEIQASSSSTTSQDSSTSSSLESNLSLLTLPSVPSLQNLSPENYLNLSVSTLCITSIKPQPFPVNFLAVHNNLLYAVSGNEINVFDIVNFNQFDTFSVQDPSSGSIKSLVFCTGKIFTAHQDCKIRVWKLIPNKKHKLISTLPTLEDRFRNFILPKNYVKIRRHKKKLWVEHYDAVSGLATGGGEKLIYSVSWDKYLKIWKSPDFRCVESVKAHDDAINAVVLSPDGLIYTGSADKRIKVWGKPNLEKKHVLIATLEKHKSAVNALALSSDGSVLFSGACDRSILVWEREDSANHMAVTGALRGHSKAILCLINISDLLFSGSADRTVRIWQRGINGRYCCLTVLDGHVKPVKSLVALPPENGENGGEINVVSGSFDGEIKVWKVTAIKKF